MVFSDGMRNYMVIQVSLVLWGRTVLKLR